MARPTFRTRMLIFAVGNIVFSVLGCAIGYFLLVQFRPEANFLELTIPRVAEMAIPTVPDSWPSYDWDPTKPYTGRRNP